MVLATIAVGLTQFGIGMFTGIVVDSAFPERKVDAPVAEGIETLAQLGVGAVVMKAMQLVVVDQLDRPRDTSFLFFVGFLASQPTLHGKIQKLVGRARLTVADLVDPVVSKVRAIVDE